MERYLPSGLVIKTANIGDPINKQGFPEFEGIITDTRYDAQGTRMSVNAVKSFAEAANNGLMVLAEHNKRGQPIGRSVSGVYDPNEGRAIARFYVQPGLKMSGAGYSTTDSYIASMKAGTTRDLSIGAKVEDESCDFCEEQIKRFNLFGMSIIYCKNGHYPQQKIFVDKNGKEVNKPGKNTREVTITSTINELEPLEFSSVTQGANQRAKIIAKAREEIEAGNVKESDLHQLSLLYGITRSNFSDLDSKIIVPGWTKGGPKMATDNKTTSAELDDLQAEVDRLKQEVENKDALLERTKEAHESEVERNTQLEDENSLLKGNDELIKTHETKITELESENNELRERMTEVRKSEYKIERYNKLLEKQKVRTLQAYTQAKNIGTNYDHPLYKSEKIEIDKVDDVETLMGWEATHNRDYLIKRKGENDQNKFGDSFQTPDSDNTRFDVRF